MKKVITFITITSCFVFANEDRYILEKTVVSGDNLQQQNIINILNDYQQEYLTRSVSVVTQQEILSSGGSGGVQGLLETVPGVVYSRSGGVGGQLSVRGMNSNNSRSIIAIDGVRVTGRSTLELNMIDPNALEGIEIIRGAASSLYGSNAINGVVNFKTRRYKGSITAPFKLSAKVRTIEFNSVNTGAASRIEILGGGDGWDILVGAHGRKGRDFKSPEGIIEKSQYQSYGTDFNIGYTSGDIRYYTQGKFQKANTYNAGGIHAKPGSYFGIIRNEDPMYEYYLRTGAEIWGQRFADKIDVYAYWRRYDTDLWIDRSSIKGAKTHNEVHNTNQVGANLEFYNAISDHYINYGISALSQIAPTPTKIINSNTGTASTSSRPTTNTELAAYAKDDYKLMKYLTLSGSLRYDYMIMQIGSKKFTGETAEITQFLDSNKTKTTGALTGSAGALLEINPTFALTTNLSRNFKSPGTSGLFPSSTTEANHDLKSEYAQSYEVGARFHDDNNYATLVFFRTDYTNMIQNIANAGKIKPINIGKAYIQGIELESHHQYDAWFIQFVAALTYGQDETKNIPLAYIAPLYGNISVGYNFGLGQVQWMQKAYLGKHRIDSTQERETDSYTMSDVYVSLNLEHFNKSWKEMWLTLGIENLFNTKGKNPTTAEDINYPIASTNPLSEPGINAFIKFAYRY